MHTYWFYLYKILESANLPIVTERRSLMTWGLRVEMEGGIAYTELDENFLLGSPCSLA
jgi:hypothetical protein